MAAPKHIKFKLTNKTTKNLTNKNILFFFKKNWLFRNDVYVNKYKLTNMEKIKMFSITIYSMEEYE